jgi:histidinol dehydrogenase
MLFIDIKDTDFEQKFSAILNRNEETGQEVEQTVAGIIADERRRGDAAVLELTRCLTA